MYFICVMVTGSNPVDNMSVKKSWAPGWFDFMFLFCLGSNQIVPVSVTQPMFHHTLLHYYSKPYHCRLNFGINNDFKTIAAQVVVIGVLHHYWFWKGVLYYTRSSPTAHTMSRC